MGSDTPTRYVPELALAAPAMAGKATNGHQAASIRALAAPARHVAGPVLTAPPFLTDRQWYPSSEHEGWAGAMETCPVIGSPLLTYVASGGGRAGIVMRWWSR